MGGPLLPEYVDDGGRRGREVHEERAVRARRTVGRLPRGRQQQFFDQFRLRAVENGTVKEQMPFQSALRVAGELA